jgi:hypothetical protein
MEDAAAVPMPFELRLTRRAAGLAALGALVARPAAALNLPSQPQVLCKVVRGGRDIGRAVYSFVPNGDQLQVGIDVDVRIRIGFITLYRYEHHNIEQWRGDRLVGFDAHTFKDGRRFFAQAQAQVGGLAVNGTLTRPYTAPGNAIGTSYWNARTLVDPLIDSENGRLLNVRLKTIGPSEALQSDGAKVPAEEYHMSGDLRLNLWYDAGRNLAGMQYFAHDGSVVTYERI